MVALALALVVVSLTIASLAWGRPQAVGGTVTITGSKNLWTLTIQNSAGSTGRIRCWSYSFPPGVFATGFQTVPAGWVVGGSKEASPPIITGRSTAGVSPGGTVAFPILTSGPFDKSGPAGSARVSEDCQRDRAAKVSFSDKPPTSTAPPCKCDSLDVATRGVVIGPSAWRLTAGWTLRCNGTTGGCKGELRGFRWVGQPAIRVAKPKTTVSCSGNCGARASKGSVPISGTAPGGTFSTSARAGRTYHFTFGAYCKGRISKRFDVTVVFDSSGRLERKKSDLNANGTRDGRERR